MAPSRGSTMLSTTARQATICSQCGTRTFSAAVILFSGHNRWSKIKHDKGKNDAAKNRQRSQFSQEITTASRLFGPEPNMNPRLADLVNKAKREGFAKVSIEAAIARGQGRSLDGASLESVTVEGMLPGNVGVIIECETDNRLRTLANVRLALRDAGGTVTPCAYLFQRRGRVTFEAKVGVRSDDALEAALDAGATDVEEDEETGRIVVLSESDSTKAVGEHIAKELGLQVATSEIMWFANEDTRVGISSEQTAGELAGFVDDLQEIEASVSNVAMNITRGSLGEESWRDILARLRV